MVCVLPTILYFDLYLYSAYAAHYFYFIQYIYIFVYYKLLVNFTIIRLDNWLHFAEEETQAQAQKAQKEARADGERKPR